MSDYTDPFLPAIDCCRAQVALDSHPQRIHGSESDPMPSPHEETCGCHWCTPKTYIAAPGDTIPFEPWHKSVYELARLLRWLELVDELPRDIPLFLETALSWSAQYDLMNEACSA